VQARVYAEDPARGFAPCPGVLTRVAWPAPAPWLRLETTVAAPGARVSPLYDPMVAKIVVTAPTRGEALDRLADALAGTALDGVETNVPFLSALVAGSAPLREGRLLTRDVPAFAFASPTVAVVAAAVGAAIIVDNGRPDLWKAG
jgi:urea carboxylase